MEIAGVLCGDRHRAVRARHDTRAGDRARAAEPDRAEALRRLDRAAVGRQAGASGRDRRAERKRICEERDERTVTSSRNHMRGEIQIQGTVRNHEKACTVPELRPFFSISDLAVRWCCSRATVYNVLRGELVLDFAANGKKGHKIVPLEVVLKIERARMRVWR